jgi:hypothetical protein
MTVEVMQARNCGRGLSALSRHEDIGMASKINARFQFGWRWDYSSLMAMVIHCMALHPLVFRDLGL